jgi:NAD(P)-dependent dehydrogenase (short-subunit alcohol dehydrogenase family)
MQSISSLSPTALITGVSRPQGLGFAVARRLAAKNYNVILAARDLTQAESLAAELRKAGHNATALQFDLTDQTSIYQAVDRLCRKIKCLDLLVNNASPMPDFCTRSALEVDISTLNQAFAVNVFGCWALIQALLPLMLCAPAARIVNVTSAAAHQVVRPTAGAFYSPAYSFAKYTLNALSSTLAVALADSSILVNAVDPGSFASHPERGDDADDRTADQAAQDIISAAIDPAGVIFGDGTLITRVR